MKQLHLFNGVSYWIIVGLDNGFPPSHYLNHISTNILWWFTGNIRHMPSWNNAVLCNCCLTTQSRYPNQCWHAIKKVPRPSSHSQWREWHRKGIRYQLITLNITHLTFLWPLLLTWINLIPAGINNYIRHKVWHEIAYPVPNFNRCTVEIFGKVISPHTLTGMWLFIHDGVKVKPC